MKIETPMKVVQYLSMGKPVIMSKVSEENVVKWSDGGLLVDPLNPQKIADIIINLIKDEKMIKKMGENGRNYVEKKLNWSTIAKKLVKIYASIN
jgi:glycosyltransferase involved in cell wall biosynthesis